MIASAYPAASPRANARALPETSVKLTLFYAPNACSLVPYVTLTEAGADFDVREVNTGAQEQKTADYLSINPKGKVPVLVVDGEPLTENVAIQQFIARRFPQARLLPTEGLAEYRAISLMAWFASTVHPHLTPHARPGNYTDDPAAHASVQRVAKQALWGDLAIAEGLLAGREWFFDHFTAVDAYFFWCFRRAGQFGFDLSEFAACSAHFARMQQRPSVQAVNAYEREVMARFAARAG
jgi:glutathione S-transferase